MKTCKKKSCNLCILFLLFHCSPNSLSLDFKYYFSTCTWQLYWSRRDGNYCILFNSCFISSLSGVHGPPHYILTATLWESDWVMVTHWASRPIPSPQPVLTTTATHWNIPSWLWSLILKMGPLLSPFMPGTCPVSVYSLQGKTGDVEVWQGKTFF